ncbi:S8 family serine peptidase [Ascidiimonas sp. W6]|uniref:S8 family serine peptidase n=1 Tax=Ascidiimonas meishanensis TaxID=3128903 RepID=UPI0030ED501A
MKIKLPFLSFLSILFLCGCYSEKIEKPFITFSNKNNLSVKIKSTTELKNWQLKDIQQDSLPGISLERAYTELLKNKKGEEVIVALLDDHLDIDHEDLKAQIWINSNEIPANGKDDDNNGYIDDVNGWNFTGNSKGEQVIYMNNETVRILRELESLYRGNTLDDFTEGKKREGFIYYQRVQNEFEKQKTKAQKRLKYADFLIAAYPVVIATLTERIPDGDFTIEKLNKIIIDSGNVKLKSSVRFMSDMINLHKSRKDFDITKEGAEAAFTKALNLDYNERTAIIGDNPEDVTDIYYGNNKVGTHLEYFQHATQVASVVAATRNNNLGIKGVSDTIKIMPVCVSTEGNEHDKDIAVGIKYAVDNGAKIINISLGKMFSLHSDWVFDAFKYAEEHGVLIVSSAGNSNYNLNEENDYYFMDNLDNGKEVSGNFLLVGSSSRQVNENLKSRFSNYGTIDVDVFAPGDSIYVAYPENKYLFNSGTSLASALTSGVAALILSYYPHLSGNDVKQILMQSGVAYDLKVNIAGRDEEPKLASFKEISKSGRILNAYNAILLASKWPVEDSN